MFKSIAAALIMVGTVFGAAGASQAASSMPTTGATSQPIGHYDFCQRFPDRCTALRETGPIELDDETWKTLVAVNEAVNGSIVARTDQEIFGVDERWAYPEVQGDCEDFLLLKQYMLEQRGIPASALLATVVRQTNGEGHAVLTVRTDRGDFVLDNLDDRIRVWSATDYTFLKRQDTADAGRWVGIQDSRSTLVGSIR